MKYNRNMGQILVGKDKNITLEELFREKARYEIHIHHCGSFIYIGSKLSKTMQEARQHGTKIIMKKKHIDDSTKQKWIATLSASKVMPCGYWCESGDHPDCVIDGTLRTELNRWLKV